MSINKEKITAFLALKSRLLGMLSAAQDSVRDSQSEANSHIGAMQSRYDTFKEEAQYLATAQQIRAINLEGSIKACERLIERLSADGMVFSTVEPGALVTIVDERRPDTEKHYLIVPDCAGQHVQIKGVEALCVTPEAPVIRSFIGLREGDYPDVYGGNDSLACSYVERIL